MARQFDENVEVLWHAKKYWGWLPWTFTDYYVVKKGNEWKKLICVSGLINKQETEMHVYRISDATYKRGFRNLIFGTGNIIVRGDEGRSMTTEEIKNVKDAQKFKDFLMDLVERERQAKGIRATEVH